MSRTADQNVIDKKTPRERLWEEIRKTPKGFTRADLCKRARIKPEAARDYLRGLERAGYIQLLHLEAVTPPMRHDTGHYFPRRHYGLLNDVGAVAPRVTRSGKHDVQGAVRQAMWTVLRINGAVDARQLANFASSDDVKVAQVSAQQYLAALREAGYMDLVAEEVKGIRGAQYRLRPAHNTGPRAPMIQRAHQLWDPNLAEVVWREEPHLEEERREGLADELA